MQSVWPISCFILPLFGFLLKFSSGNPDPDQYCISNVGNQILACTFKNAVTDDSNIASTLVVKMVKKIKSMNSERPVMVSLLEQKFLASQY